MCAGWVFWSKIRTKAAAIPVDGSPAQTAQEFLGSWAVVLSASRSDAIAVDITLSFV